MDYEGNAKCSEGMHWFAKKVFPTRIQLTFQGVSVASGTTLDETFYSDYRKGQSNLVSINTLSISSDDTPLSRMQARPAPNA